MNIKTAYFNDIFGHVMYLKNAVVKKKTPSSKIAHLLTEIQRGVRQCILDSVSFHTAQFTQFVLRNHHEELYEALSSSYRFVKRPKATSLHYKRFYINRMYFQL